MIQETIVTLIGLAAVAYLVYRFVPGLGKKKKPHADCSCEKPPAS